MGFTDFGSQERDTPKTLTLRQWCKQNPDIPLESSIVKVVFKPTTYASYTFVTEHDFKVVVEKGSTLAHYLEENLQSALDAGTCLYIRITNRDKGSWAVSALEGNKQFWEEMNWGWLSDGTVIASAPKTKPSRRGRRDEEDAGADGGLG